MQEFDQQLLRLKAQLRVTSDQDVAALLGMSKAAFSDRKRRGSFPVDKLQALAHQRPDLPLDVLYVLTGKTVKERYTVKTGQAPANYETLTRYAVAERDAAYAESLSDDERELLRLFRAAPLKLKMQTVALLSGDVSTDRKGGGVSVKGSGHRVAGRDYRE